jgi:uncharacterized ferredoxin-like protein
MSNDDNQYLTIIEFGNEKDMTIINSIDAEGKAILVAAKLLAVTARTAPKGRGVDRIVTAIITGEEKERIAQAMEEKSEHKKNLQQVFKRDAANLRQSPVVLLIGVKGTVPKNPENPLNCGACGHSNCARFIKVEKTQGEDFTGPICLFEALDLGIALGAAVQRASELNIDNRMMYTIGAAAKALDMMKADVIIGIPLSVTGKNIFFDRK